jgi:hypothetical protein
VGSICRGDKSQQNGLILLALSVKLRDGGTYDTLLHRKALLVIAACNADDLVRERLALLLSSQLHCGDGVSYIALPFITQAVGGDLIAHTLLHEDAQLAVIFDLDQFLGPVGRV